jgi:hypothetical protein
VQDPSKQSTHLGDNGCVFEIKRISKKKNPTVPREGALSEIQRSFIIGVKGDLSQPNKEQAQSYRSISLAGVPEPK